MVGAPHYKTALAQDQEYLPDSRTLLGYSSLRTTSLDPISNQASDYFSRVLQEAPMSSIGYTGFSAQKMNDMYRLMEDNHLLKKNIYEN